MLLALIAIAWLAVTALCVAVCMMARRGDAESEPAPRATPAHARTDRRRSLSATGEGLVVWDSLPELSVQVRDARLTVHGAR
jgi:hypothetical protein